MGGRGCVGIGRPGLSVSALLARARERRSGAGDAVGQQALEAAPGVCDRARVAHEARVVMQGQDQAVHLDSNCIASASALRWPSSMMGKQTSSSNRAWYSRMQS